ncbi:MAG: hypothetical protein WCV85_06155 [Patescibacteria group bacterium]
MPIHKVQEFLVEVDSPALLKQYLTVAMPTVLDATQELAVKMLDRTSSDFSLHLPPVFKDQSASYPVLFIGGWHAPEPGRPNSYFNGYGPWKTFQSVDAAIDHVQKVIKKSACAWGSAFLAQCGDGYNAGFNTMDGTVRIGFQIRSCRSFPEYLAISLVHMYYGK